MIVGQRANLLWLVLHGHTALSLCGLQVIQALEVPIGYPFVGERPQSFARLQLRRVRRQEEQMNAFRHVQFLARLPAGPIHHQQDALTWAGPDRLSKVGQGQREDSDSDRGQEQPLTPSRDGMPKGVEIHPLIAVLDQGARAGASADPPSAEDGLEPDAMLIGGPQLDSRFRVRVLKRA